LISIQEKFSKEVSVRVNKEEFDQNINEIRILLQGTEKKVEVFVN
jgi:hypothetical protein